MLLQNQWQLLLILLEKKGIKSMLVPWLVSLGRRDLVTSMLLFVLLATVSTSMPCHVMLRRCVVVS
jgi:hypothetical protein